MSILQLRQGVVATPNEPSIALSVPLRQTVQVQCNGPSSNARPKWRILVVEEDKINRQRLIKIISEQPDLVSCGEGENLVSARAAVALYKPDLLLVDPSLACDDGFALTNSLRAEFPGLRLLIYSRCDEGVYAEKALQAGANGYIMKQEPPAELLTAIRTVLNDRIYLGYSLSLKVIQRLLDIKPESRRNASEPRRGV